MRTRFSVKAVRKLTLLALLLPLCVCGQSNVLTGTVANYGLTPKPGVLVKLTLVSPKPRVVDGVMIQNDPVPIQSGTNGTFAFTNILWGKYTLAVGNMPTTWTVNVGTNTTGTVPIGSLADSATPVPPNPATNYYTQSQVDALIAGVESGELPDGVVTNGQSNVSFLGSNYLANAYLGTAFLSEGVGLAWDNDANTELYGTPTNFFFIVDGSDVARITSNGDVIASRFIGDGSQLTGVSTSEPLDAGSVPVADRLAFAVGDGTYVRATVHPNAVWLPTNWNGAQIWLTFTGTTNQTETAFGTATEDPFIYASADGGNTWTLKSSAPLLSRAASCTLAGWSTNGWQADPEIFLDTNGVMRVIWMGFHTGAGGVTNAMFETSSTDGTTWSTPTLLKKWKSDVGNPWSTNATCAGPQIVTLPGGGLRLYYTDDSNYGTNAAGAATNTLCYVSGLDSSGTNWDWSTVNRCALTPYLTNSVTPWHFDIALVSSNRWFLAYGSQASSFIEYATSADGITWSPPGMGFLLPIRQKSEEYGYYKLTWQPVAGPNGLSWNVIANHTGTNQLLVNGWNFSLARNLEPEPQELTYTGANTNWTLIGGTKTYNGINRIGALTVVDDFKGTSSGKVGIGQPFNGWGGIAIGYNSPMAATNYVLASDGLTETRLNARAGAVNTAIGNAVKSTVTSSNASFAVPLYADGSGISNVIAGTLVNAANVTNLSVWGSGVAEGTRLWFMDEQLAYAGGTWYFTGGVDFSGAEVEGLVGIATSSSSTPLAARGIAGQTANLFEVQDSSSNALVSVSPSGALSVSNITASGTISGNALGATNIPPTGLQNSQARWLITDGDSLSSPVGSPSLQWAQNQMTNFQFFAGGKVVSFGQSGWCSQWVLTNAAANYAPYAKTDNTMDIWYSLYVGNNDIDLGTNYLDTINNISNLWTIATNSGWNVIAWTIQQRGGGYNGVAPANRTNINNWIRANYRAWNAVLFEPDLVFPDSPNLAWFYDGEHWTTNAQMVICRELDNLCRNKSGGWRVTEDVFTNLHAGSPSWVVQLEAAGGTNLILGASGAVKSVGTLTASGITSSNANVNVYLANNATFKAWAQSSNELGNAATLMLSSNKVGIGSVRPLAPLEVQTTAGYRRAVRLGPQTSTDGDGAYIEFTSSSTDGLGGRVGGGREGSGGAGFLSFSTGNTSILERMRITSDGTVSVSNTLTASNFVSTATGTTPSFKAGGTNGIVLKCPDGGSYILRIGNDGTLSTVTNSTGL